MSCSTGSSWARSTRSSTYFTVQITCPPIWKCPNSSGASLVKYLLHKLNRMDDKQLPCQTLLPIFTLLVSPGSSFGFNSLTHVQLADHFAFPPNYTSSFFFFILVINQLDAQNFCFTLSLFHASTCFKHHVLIIRRSKLYYTASGIITLIDGRPVHRLREDIKKYTSSL